MTSREIRARLRKVIEDWIASVDDIDLRASLRNEGVILAGGALASLYLGEDPKDYDIYLPSLELRNKVMDYYTNLTRTETRTNTKGEVTLVHPDGYRVFSPPAYRIKAITRNAITLETGTQIIVRYYGLPTQILKEFDFAHTKNAYIYPRGELVLKPEALESLLTKELRYIETKYPIAAFIRSQKFIHRGFTMDMPDMFKMVAQINALDLTNGDVLQDQLLGVSATVAVQFVEAIQNLTVQIGENPFVTETAKDNYELLAEAIDNFFEDAKRVEV